MSDARPHRRVRLPQAPWLVGLALAAGCGSAPVEPPPVDPAFAACDGATWPAQLRLLTRREYESTVKDLLGAPPAGSACATDTHCDVKSESCVAGACAADPCGLVTFAFPAAPGAYGSVVVAGSFNGWSLDTAYPLAWEPAAGAWVGKRPLDPGTHQYKFVLDGTTWVADPSNPATADDGFGGVNSVLTIACDGSSGGGAEGLAGLATDLPVESRPEHYPFDNHASALVTTVHVEQYLRAAARAVKATDLAGLLLCSPSEGASCAEAFVESFGARAFRRPLAAPERDRYRELVLAQPTFLDGVGVAVEVMLSSPLFLYRSEVGTPLGDGTSALDAWELASLLSYTYWGTMPDDALFDAAATGQLDTDEGVAAEVERLLSDPRAREHFGVFAGQWLGTERADTLTKSGGLYPGWSAELAASAEAEAGRFVAELLVGGGSLADLYLSSASWIDGRLASLYGLPAGAAGFELRELPPERRAGLLGLAGVLATTAHSDQTSPVRRGLFVRERLLCQTLGAPPPQAGGVPDIDPNATTRERFAEHSASPQCAGCHQFIDPVGFGFEAFDAIGAHRTTENGKPIDASGQLDDVDGLGTNTEAPFATLPELGGLLAASDGAAECVATQAYRFAKGALETSADPCTLDALSRVFNDANHDLGALLRSLPRAPGFRRRK